MLASLSEPYFPRRAPDPSPAACPDDASAFIDRLLQDTYLFVMDIHHQPVLVRDEALYKRAVTLVETVQETLKARKESDDFIDHVIYAQCAMLDDVVLNTAPSDDNHAWLRNPLQVRFVNQMLAGEVMPARTRELLRQPVPDPRLLVLYQRLYGMGYGWLWEVRYRAHAARAKTAELAEALNALVPGGDRPLSASLLVARRPTVRTTLYHSRLARFTLAVLLTAGLMAGLQSSLRHLLQTVLPG